MKKVNKEKLRDGFIEALIEIALTLVLFGIGALIVSLFGIKLDDSEIDSDLIVLIGFVAVAVVIAAIYLTVRAVRKTHRKKAKKKDENGKDNNL